MLPVLFHVFGIPINSYGASKALAVGVAGWVLAREFRRLGWDPERAWNIAIAATVVGFVGGKLYYLAEHAGNLTPHDFGSAGFTWYGGLFAGVATVAVMSRWYRLPLGDLAGAASIPLALGYGIGRIGCFLAGDGTYGRPTDLPWGVTYPHGMMPTTVPVHPTELYETALAFMNAGLLWTVRTRLHPWALFGTYAVLSGIARFFVEFLRTNQPVWFGFTQPQVWSLLLVVIGAVLVARYRKRPAPVPPVGRSTTTAMAGGDGEAQ